MSKRAKSERANEIKSKFPIIEIPKAFSDSVHHGKDPTVKISLYAV